MTFIFMIKYYNMFTQSHVYIVVFFFLHQILNLLSIHCISKMYLKPIGFLYKCRN